jgi:hypothetical protein
MTPNMTATPGSADERTAERPSTARVRGTEPDRCRVIQSQPVPEADDEAGAEDKRPVLRAARAQAIIPASALVRAAGKLIVFRTPAATMRKDVREFIRRIEAVGLTVESTPGHYRVLRDGKPLRKANGCRSRCRSRPTRSAGGERRSSSLGSSASSRSPRGRKSRSLSTFRLPGLGVRPVNAMRRSGACV